MSEKSIRKVFITGAGGMVGRNLSDLLATDSKVEIFTPARGELNLLDPKAVENYILKVRPDFIVHCAGVVGGIAANLASPSKFLVDNWEMGKNVMIASLALPNCKIVNLGSSCMYPKNARNPLSEDLLLTGSLEPTNEGYALAKISVERLCRYLNLESKSGTRFKTLVPCNLYGKYDKFDPQKSHMIPAVIRKIYEAKSNGSSSVSIWGDGTARREFMYAEDLAAVIYEAIINFEKFPETMNVGLGFDYSILDYYKEISEVVGYSGNFQFDLSKPVGMKQKLVDTSLMNKIVSLKTTPLKAGIRKTLEYFLKNEVNE